MSSKQTKEVKEITVYGPACCDVCGKPVYDQGLMFNHLSVCDKKNDLYSMDICDDCFHKHILPLVKNVEDILTRGNC